MSNRTPGTQHLTALAAPGELIDWRLALCFETAHHTGILDTLPATAEHIASTRQLDTGAVRSLLCVLAEWGHVTVDDHGVFSAGPKALGADGREALAQHGSWIRRWAALIPRRIHDRRASAPETPRSLDPATGLRLLESASQPFIVPTMNVCMEALRTRSAASDRPRVLDLGGGHGAYALEFARRGCRTTMQDLPAVIECARAEGRLTCAGVALHAADAHEELAEGPFDLALCGTVTNLFSLDQVGNLLDRLRGSLTPEGQVAIATWMRDRGPVGAAFGVQMLVATPDGDAHSETDYRQVLESAGYSNIGVTEVGQPPLGVILARR